MVVAIQANPWSAYIRPDRLGFTARPIKTRRTTCQRQASKIVHIVLHVNDSVSEVVIHTVCDDRPGTRPLALSRRSLLALAPPIRSRRSKEQLRGDCDLEEPFHGPLPTCYRVRPSSLPALLRSPATGFPLPASTLLRPQLRACRAWPGIRWILITLKFESMKLSTASGHPPLGFGRPSESRLDSVCVGSKIRLLLIVAPEVNMNAVQLVVIANCPELPEPKARCPCCLWHGPMRKVGASGCGVGPCNLGDKERLATNSFSVRGAKRWEAETLTGSMRGYCRCSRLHLWILAEAPCSRTEARRK